MATCVTVSVVLVPLAGTRAVLRGGLDFRRTPMTALVGAKVVHKPQPTLSPASTSTPFYCLDNDTAIVA